MRRSKNGWIPRILDSTTGHDKETTFDLMSSGLLTAGVLFVKNFATRHLDTYDIEVIEILRLCDEFY